MNSEKDPVDGTSPDKLLFDKSLRVQKHSQNHIIANKFHRLTYYISPDSTTYRTWRAVILVKDLGIVPDKLLLLSRLSFTEILNIRIIQISKKMLKNVNKYANNRRDTTTLDNNSLILK